MFTSVLRASARSTLRPSLVSTPKCFFSTSRAMLNTSNYKLNKDSHVYKYLNEGPASVKYTAEHEYLVTFGDDSSFVGITKYAAEALGDVTFVELPEVGDKVEAGEAIGSVESVKSASEIYSPVSGEIIAVNEVLESQPQVLNVDPMGNGWIAHIKLSDPKEVETSEDLLTEEAYAESLDS